MKKSLLKGLYVLGLVVLIAIFVYNLIAAFNAITKHEFVRNISLLMLSIVVLGILIVVYYFGDSIREKSKDRIIGLVKRKVYTTGGDYIGDVEDVLLGENKIYGLKVTSIKGIKKKKIIILSGMINNYGEVVLVNSSIIDKL